MNQVAYSISEEVGDTQLHGLILATPCCRDPPHKTPWRSFSKALGGDGGNLRRGLETLILSNWLNRRAKNGTMQYKGAVQRALWFICLGFQIGAFFKSSSALCVYSPIFMDVARSRNCDRYAPAETRQPWETDSDLDNHRRPWVVTQGPIPNPLTRLQDLDPFCPRF